MKILRIVILYERNDPGTAKYFSDALYVRLKRHNELFEFESIVLKYLRLLVKTDSGKAKVEIFKAMKTDLIALKAKDDIAEIDHLMVWVDGKLG